VKPTSTPASSPCRCTTIHSTEGLPSANPPSISTPTSNIFAHFVINIGWTTNSTTATSSSSSNNNKQFVSENISDGLSSLPVHFLRLILCYNSLDLTKQRSFCCFLARAVKVLRMVVHCTQHLSSPDTISTATTSASVTINDSCTNNQQLLQHEANVDCELNGAISICYASHFTSILCYSFPQQWTMT
jgi:hypothetical protein